MCFLPSQYLIYYTTVLCCVCIYVGCLSLYTVGSDSCVMSVARQPWSETVGIFSFLFLIPLSLCVSVTLCVREFSSSLLIYLDGLDLIIWDVIEQKAHRCVIRIKRKKILKVLVLLLLVLFCSVCCVLCAVCESTGCTCQRRSISRRPGPFCAEKRRP